MRTLAIASGKGGTCKTTITSALAVRAAADFPLVAMIDFDAQQTLTGWWNTRGRPDNLVVYDIDKLAEDVAAIRDVEGADWLLIDTAPMGMKAIEGVIAVADAVLIPVRPGIFDALAIEEVVGFAKKHRKPHAIVLAAVDPRMTGTLAEARAALVTIAPLCATSISHAEAYIQAPALGKTGPEINKALKSEIDSLWVEVRRLAGDEPAPAKKGGRRYGR